MPSDNVRITHPPVNGCLPTNNAQVTVEYQTTVENKDQQYFIRVFAGGKTADSEMLGAASSWTETTVTFTQRLNPAANATVTAQLYQSEGAMVGLSDSKSGVTIQTAACARTVGDGTPPTGPTRTSRETASPRPGPRHLHTSVHCTYDPDQEDEVHRIVAVVTRTATDASGEGSPEPWAVVDAWFRAGVATAVIPLPQIGQAARYDYYFMLIGRASNALLYRTEAQPLNWP